MQDARRFISEAKLAGASVRQLGNESLYAEQGFASLGRRGFWLQQIFFTVRRVVYGLTLTLGVLAAAAIKTGFSFNSMIEQQTLAFKIFTGSAKGAKDEVQFLFDLAAHGPFEFQQVIQGARQLQAFGFTVGETEDVLVKLQDAMAGMGLDQAALDRATLALGQIRSSGRLLGQDLRQLEQLGLVNPEDLARRLGIQQAQLANIGQLNIPSKVAIDAITAYWVEHFKGAAKQFQTTWAGEISTLKDYGRSLFGAMVEPLQKRLERETLPTITKIAQEANKGFRAEGMEGFFKAIDRGVGHGVSFLNIYRSIRGVLTPLLGILRELGIDFLAAFRILGIGTKAAKPLGFALSVIYDVLKLIRPILIPLITLWIAEKTAIGLVTLALKAKIFWTIVDTVWTTRLARAETIYLVWLLRRYYWTKAMAFMETLWIGVQLAALAVTGLLTGAIETLTIAIMTNPLSLVLVAALLVVAGLVLLYFKWKWFHNLIDSIAHWIYNHAYILALVPIVGPMLAVTVFIIRHIRTLIGWFQKLVHWAKQVIHWFGKIKPPHLGGLPGPDWLWRLPSFSNPFGLAAGGDVTRGGYFTVGEHGREIVSLPSGAAVRPIEPANIGGLLKDKFPLGELLVKIPVYLSDKKIAEGVARVNLDKEARA